MCGPRVNQALMLAMGDLVDLEHLEFQLVELLLKSVHHLILVFRGA